MIGFQSIYSLDSLNLDQFKHYLNSLPDNDDIKNAIEKIENCQLLDFHEEIADRQRTSYNSMRNDTDFLQKNLLIEIDYKQKIILGKSPRQRNRDYYDGNMAQRSLLGFGLYYVDSSKQIQCLNMDIVFHESKQTCLHVIKAINFVRKQDVFKAIDKRHWTIWTDCGTHFRYFINFN